MEERTRHRASAMLAALLERGHTYREVAADWGIGPSTVERQVKALLWDVVRHGPIPGLSDLQLASLHQLRSNARAVMEAVRRADAAAQPQQGLQLRDLDIAHGVRCIRRLSENGNRDVALLYVLITTGAKPLEIARLKVRHYLREDGAVRSETTVARGSDSPGRLLFFESLRACEALDVYLEERLRRRIAVTGAPEYRGLDPESALFLTEAGKPFRIKPRSPSDPRETCPTLSATFALIFQRAGWKGLNTQHFRRHFAQHLARKGADRRQLAQLLGVTSTRSVKRLLSGEAPRLDELVKDVV